jgi:large subunit ribosomal protein L21
MQYAIIRSGNKQYQAIAGKTLKVEKLASSTGPVVFEEVLLSVDGDKVEVGTPTLGGIKVYGTAMGLFKADKIQVFKYKSKSRYRKLRGHRQQYTLVKIESIGTEPATPKPAARKVKKATVKKSTK